MILTVDQRKEFEEAAKVVMKWLNLNCHPHAKAIITTTDAELVEGEFGFQTDEYIQD